jgi:hypothetical protein
MLHLVGLETHIPGCAATESGLLIYKEVRPDRVMLLPPALDMYGSTRISISTHKCIIQGLLHEPPTEVEGLPAHVWCVRGPGRPSTSAQVQLVFNPFRVAPCCGVDGQISPAAPSSRLLCLFRFILYYVQDTILSDLYIG